MKIFEHTDDDGDKAYVQYDNRDDANPYVVTTVGRGGVNATSVEVPADKATALADAIIHGSKRRIETTEAEPAADAADLVYEPAVLTIDQQRRQDAVYASRTALMNTAGSIMSKGNKIESPAALLSVAHYIITGDRDYISRADELIERQTDAT